MKKIFALALAFVISSTMFGFSAFATAPTQGFSDVPLTSFFSVGDFPNIFDLSATSGLNYKLKAAPALDTPYFSFSGNYRANIYINRYLVIKLKKSDIKFQVLLRTASNDAQQKLLQDWSADTVTADPKVLVYDLSLASLAGLNITNAVTDLRVGILPGPGVWGVNPINSTINIEDIYFTNAAANIKPATSTTAVSRVDNDSIKNISEYDTLTFNNDNTFTLTNKPAVNAGDFSVNLGGIDLTKTPYLYVDVKSAPGGIVVDFIGETTSGTDPEYIRILNSAVCMAGLLKFDLRNVYPNGIAADSKKYVRVFTIGNGASNVYNGIYFGGTLFQTGPVISIGEYNGTTATVGPIIVSATTDKGTLNADSHTFTENGSFDFIATDPDTGLVTVKNVTITNIGTETTTAEGETTTDSTDTTTDTTTDDSPKTGDNLPMMMIVLAAISVAGLTLAKKKVKSN